MYVQYTNQKANKANREQLKEELKEELQNERKHKTSKIENTPDYLVDELPFDNPTHLTKCQNCGYSFPVGSEKNFCPRCGYKTSTPSRLKKSKYFS